MSTYAYAKLYLFHEDKDGQTSLVNENDIDVNYMKNLLLGSSWPDELEGYDADISAELGVKIGYDMIGYLDPKMAAQMKDDGYLTDENEHSLFVNELTDIHTLSEKYSFKQKADSPEVQKWKKVYRKTGSYSQVWVTEGMLSDAAEKYAGDLAEKYKSFFEKEQLTKSLEYYKLTEDQKEALNEDICCLKDSIEECKISIQSCYQMIGAIDGFKEANEKDYSDRVECCLYLC